MSFESITNQGEFFSNHYLDEVIAGNLSDIRSHWDEREGKGDATTRSRLKGGASEFFARAAQVKESTSTNRERRLHRLHDHVLATLGFDVERVDRELKHNTEHVLAVPVAARVDTSTGLLLVVIEAGNAKSVDDLFSFEEAKAHQGTDQPGQLLQSVRRNIDKRSVPSAADAVGEIFGTDDPPRYVIVLAGAIVLLAERAKWAEGRYLAVDLALAFDRNDTKAKGELETVAALFGCEALVPTDGQSVFETLVDNSHKHAVGVSKDLRVGIRDSIEIIANEVIAQRDHEARRQGRKLFTRSNVDARDLTRQSLRYLYRLIVLLYAESRPELGIVPIDDEAYVEGYSLDRLRELCLVDLEDDHSRNGTHFQQSLDRLFELVNVGYHSEDARLFQNVSEQESNDDRQRSQELYIQFPGLDAQLFDPASTGLINQVPLRNEALQLVLQKLMLSKGKKRSDSAGFISYAQLGINQLGAVYEGLMAYTGFYADSDLYEVAKGGDPTDGTWMLPMADADEYPDDVFVMTEDEAGRKERVLHEQGSFVFRLSGRDRQRSASYYTPEVLTECVVKHALAELLGMDKYAPEHGSSGIIDAVDMLDLTICEPALGSGAFANEAINQLSAEYLRRRQAELGEVLDPSRYATELQKVKAHFALHQTYGVDLNATAVELAEVSLWLNAMHQGLKAPWFGLQLRQGNSLIGCRRSTWKTSQLADKPWKNTKKGNVQPPVDRSLADPLQADEVHHFLFPGHGWAAVADRKEAKELRPDEVASLKEWRKRVLAAPKRDDAKRLTALARGVEAMWASAAERVRLTQRGLRRDIAVYGTEQSGNVGKPPTPTSRADAERAMTDPNSPLGRLRTLMDAWVGLWFWPLEAGETPPSWNQWLTVAEELIRPDERGGMAGQLDLFDDLADLLEAEAKQQQGQTSVDQLKTDHSWLWVATDAARREGAWHWDLEFAPAFQNGGFDLQVGNPPWVRPTWDGVAARADHVPALVLNPATARDLSEEELGAVVQDLTSSSASLEFLTSPLAYPELAGQQANLYLNFLVLALRSSIHTAGLVHQDTHMRDPDASDFRSLVYRRMRRRFHFRNELKLFEEVKNNTSFSANVYGRPGSAVDFFQLAWLYRPDTIDRSFSHLGQGPLPGVKDEHGNWDCRPHDQRIVAVDAARIKRWSQVIDGPAMAGGGGRSALPVTLAEADSIEVFAEQKRRMSGNYSWERGFEPGKAITDGWISDAQSESKSLADLVVLAGHIEPATPVAQEPHIPFRSNRDYVAIDIESFGENALPVSNYSIADHQRVGGNQKRWDGKPSNAFWRVAWRVRTDPGGVRSLQAALVPPGPIHNHGVHTLRMASNGETVDVAALWATLDIEYLLRLLGKDNLQDELVQSFPLPDPSNFRSESRLRILRLSGVSGHYASLWEELFDPLWQDDAWTDLELTRSSLGDVASEWTMDTPLRRDQDRWQALVELDALAALMLGLTADQLCAMYRTQFAVLRKYEYKMVFDAEGRKICGYHQSAGYRQSQRQDEAKAPGSNRPKEWKNLWNLFEQYEADPSSVDWQGHYTAPFTRVDREAAMTRAYEAFTERHDVPKQ